MPREQVMCAAVSCGRVGEGEAAAFGSLLNVFCSKGLAAWGTCKSSGVKTAMAPRRRAPAHEASLQPWQFGYSRMDSKKGQRTLAVACNRGLASADGFVIVRVLDLSLIHI